MREAFGVEVWLLQLLAEVGSAARRNGCRVVAAVWDVKQGFE